MKEYDIYLRNHLTKCDLVVYSIPYRNGMTIINRLILNCCLEDYVLQKFVATQMGSELSAHIDEMIKLCLERLELGSELGVEAEFDKSAVIYPSGTAVELNSELVNVLETSFIQAQNAMALGVDDMDVKVTKSPGTAESGLVLDTQAGIFKQDYEEAASALELGADIQQLQGTKQIEVLSELELDARLQDLCYRVTATGETAIEIAATLLGTELHHSFGDITTAMVLDGQIEKEQAQKFLAVYSATQILAELTETITQYMQADTMAVEAVFEAACVLKRYRLLEDMDANALGGYDEMTLDEVDYVIV